LCPNQAFSKEPAAAFCSASLIDDDVILTAGHCLGADESSAGAACSRLRVVFDYRMLSAEVVAPIDADAVFSCRRVLALEANPPGFGLDFAMLQLDRPVPRERAPLRVQPVPPEVGDRVTLATYPAGLPLKIEQGALVQRSHDASYFEAASDSFAGGSGGAVLNELSELVGFQLLGEPDWDVDNGCLRARVVDESREKHALVGVAIERLCRTGWPSLALCERSPKCGDGWCTATESRQDCPDDCPAPSCADHLCERSEWLSCQHDCSAFDHVPASWSEDPTRYPAPTPTSNEASHCGVTAPRGQSGDLAWLAASLLCMALRARRPPRRGRLAIPPASAIIRS
jgi:hypothetical protein